MEIGWVLLFGRQGRLCGINCQEDCEQNYADYGYRGKETGERPDNYANWQRRHTPAFYVRERIPNDNPWE